MVEPEGERSREELNCPECGSDLDWHPQGHFCNKCGTYLDKIRGKFQPGLASSDRQPRLLAYLCGALFLGAILYLLGRAGNNSEIGIGSMILLSVPSLLILFTVSRLPETWPQARALGFAASGSAAILAIVLLIHLPALGNEPGDPLLGPLMTWIVCMIAAPIAGGFGIQLGAGRGKPA